MSTTFLPPRALSSPFSSPGLSPAPKRVSVPGIRSRKLANKRGGILCLTAYDYTMAALLDRTGIVDVILVGDSLSGIVQGFETTLPVTLEEMIYHCKCVSRGAQRAVVVGDMPFMTYQVSPEQALETAGRLVKEGGVAAVKLEGGVEIAPTVARLVAAGIPVIGHVGLTPQSYHTLGGHVRQGKTPQQRVKILTDAEAVADAGAFSIVLECIPETLAQEITSKVQCPTIGIGSGTDCDGQILVINDLLGLRLGTAPGFVQPEANLADEIAAAVGRFAERLRGVETDSVPESISVNQ